VNSWIEIKQVVLELKHYDPFDRTYQRTSALFLLKSL
jgi:hypothetical protein